MLEAGNTGKCREGIFGIGGSDELGFAKVVFCLGIFELGLGGAIKHADGLVKRG